MYHPELIRHPDSCPALVLNADYTPLSYYPLSLWPWQTAIKAMFLERVDIVAHYDREVHSPSRSLKLPSVIALNVHVGFRRSAAALLKVAGRAGGRDILPHGPAALRARRPVIERRLLVRPAV